MGCCGDRGRLAPVRPEQKWEYINLDDFRSNSCWTPLSYVVLYISLFVSVAVYAVDTFTAINLLAFDRWSGQIKPAIPLEISRWIFAGCILLSFILLAYRWYRAICVMKLSGVAQSYLDPLAVRVQSVRMGKDGRGWKRFLVFAELTKSKKGTDYVALFTYFSFEAWLRIIFAEGPRQAVNALTLYSVMQLNLIPEGQHAAKDGHSPIVQFFVNVGVLAGSNKEQAVILFGMLFTLIIWVISAISLMIAVVLYLVFLFHHIPSADGGLKGYCRRKINRRVEKIVYAKVDKALRKGVALRARRDVEEGRNPKREPTLPNLENDHFEKASALSRQTTMTTLPEYSSRPPTAASYADSLSRQPRLPDLTSNPNRPLPPSRSETLTSTTSYASYGSNAPLIGGASGMAHMQLGEARSPEWTTSPQEWDSRPVPTRSLTSMSQSTQRNFSSGPRSPSGNPPGSYQMEPLPRSHTAGSGASTVGRRTHDPLPSPVHSLGRRSPAGQDNPYFPPIPRAASQAVAKPQRDARSPTPSPLPLPRPRGRGPPKPVRIYPSEDSPSVQTNNHIAAASTRSLTSASSLPALPRLQTSGDLRGHDNNKAYIAYSPNSFSPSPHSSATTPHEGGYRNFTQPNPIRATEQFGRQTTSPLSAPATLAPRRVGTAPPTTRQTSPTGDNVMADITHGY